MKQKLILYKKIYPKRHTMELKLLIDVNIWLEFLLFGSNDIHCTKI